VCVRTIIDNTLEDLHFLSHESIRSRLQHSLYYLDWHLIQTDPNWETSPYFE
jgi:hypothetical protein